MSDYEEDQFEKEEDQAAKSQKAHKMKISIDFLTIKDLRVSANLMLQYSLKLLQQTHSFKSGKPTAVAQNQEVKLTHVFAAFEFQATKQELYSLLNDSTLLTKIMHRESGNQRDTDLGEVEVQLKELLQAPMK